MTRPYSTGVAPTHKPFSTSVLPRPVETYHSTTYERLSYDHGFDGCGKTVLVTGGASGVGLEISKAFASQGVKQLIIVSRNKQQQEKARAELQSAHPALDIILHEASVSDPARMDDILRQRTPDVLVLNAAVAHRRALASEITQDEMFDSFEINTFAPFNIARTYLECPQPVSGCKTIINLSGAAAHLLGPYRVGYGPSKAASAQIMQAFAAQFTDTDRVRIFNYHPGSFYTPGVAQNIPKNKMVWEDIRLPAHFAIWLAGRHAGFLHGRYVWANWDVDELMALKDRIQAEPDFLTIGLIQ